MKLGLNEYIIYAVLIIAQIFMYFWFVTNSINQITQFLDIYCLTIKKKDGEKGDAKTTKVM